MKLNAKAIFSYLGYLLLALVLVLLLGFYKFKTQPPKANIPIISGLSKKASNKLENLSFILTGNKNLLPDDGLNFSNNEDSNTKIDAIGQLLLSREIQDEIRKLPHMVHACLDNISNLKAEARKGEKKELITDIQAIEEQLNSILIIDIYNVYTVKVKSAQSELDKIYQKY